MHPPHRHPTPLTVELREEMSLSQGVRWHLGVEEQELRKERQAWLLELCCRDLSGRNVCCLKLQHSQKAVHSQKYEVTSVSSFQPLPRKVAHQCQWAVGDVSWVLMPVLPVKNLLIANCLLQLTQTIVVFLGGPVSFALFLILLK